MSDNAGPLEPPDRAAFLNARTNGYANVNLAGIKVQKAESEEDFKIVAQLREAGFSRVSRNAEGGGTASPNRTWLDDIDHQLGIFSLIGYDDMGTPIATMRVQDGRVADLELERFVSVDSLLTHEQKPAMQCARLSVIKSSQSANVMFAVFKSAWLWCLREEMRSIIIATPQWSKHVYDYMLFADFGAKGCFLHDFAGGAPHVSMQMPVAKAEEIWRAENNPLCEQFFDIRHPALDFEQ
ncbi:MAG: hypothetical protein ACRD2U_10295 [Terriglobales bacterium]